MSIALPPGPRHLLNLLPTFAIPSLVVYLFTLTFDFPPWFTITAVIFARPLLFLAAIPHNQWTSRRAAASLGAIIPPVVQEWSIFTAKNYAKLIGSDYPGGVFEQFSHKYGNVFQLEVLNQCMVMTSEPEHIKAVFATHFEDFTRGPVVTGISKSLLGSGIFNSDGELWKFHRAMTRPFFSRERISDCEIYERHSELSVNLMKKRIGEGLPIDMQDLFSRFTLDSTAEFLYGHSIGSLSAGIVYPPDYAWRTPKSFYDHPSTTFINVFDQGQILTMARSILYDQWPLFEFWSDRVKPARDVMDAYIEPIMRQALARQEVKNDTEEEETTLLGHLVCQTQDPTILKDELLNLLIAGRDTTASLLTFAMYMLAEHPDIEARLRKEIWDVVGPTGSPTYQQMRDLKFMRAFLNEVLRLFPPAPLDVRCSEKAMTLPPAKSPGSKPIFIPVNTPVYTLLIHMHRRTDIWGPDALKFDPDRFLDERLQKYFIPNPFIFLPFIAGPRICLGQQFAYNEATFILVRLLQNFTKFTLDNTVNIAPPAQWASGTGRKPLEKVYPLAHLTMFVKGGLWVRMEELPKHD